MAIGRKTWMAYRIVRLTAAILTPEATLLELCLATVSWVFGRGPPIATLAV